MESTSLEEQEHYILRKKKSEALVRSLMKLHVVAKKIDRVDSEWLQEFEVKMGKHQTCALSPFLSTAMVWVVTELARKYFPSKMMYADDIFLMSETTGALRNQFRK